MRVVYGMNPVRELLRARTEGVSELWLAEGQAEGRRFAELSQLARSAGAKVREAPRQKLDRVAGTEAHQGVVATVADFKYRDLEDLLELVQASDRPALLLILDGIEDPQNLGAIIRSAHAMGAHGVIIPKDRAAGITPAVDKASAGAVEHCPVARVTNVVQSIERLKEAGIWTVATAADGDRPVSEVDLAGPIAVVIGGEGQGIRPLVRRTCDYIAYVPMLGKVGSLNASAAAAMVLYEGTRQRTAKGKGKGGK